MRVDYYSIGFLREDYDFEIMATISNGGGVMGNSGFDMLLENTLKLCQSLAPELEKHFNITEAMLYGKL